MPLTDVILWLAAGFVVGIITNGYWKAKMVWNAAYNAGIRDALREVVTQLRRQGVDAQVRVEDEDVSA